MTSVALLEQSRVRYLFGMFTSGDYVNRHHWWIQRYTIVEWERVRP